MLGLVFVMLFDWQAFVPAMTGPDPQQRLGVRAGINASWKFDWDRDGDLDLRDIAEFQNRFAVRS